MSHIPKFISMEDCSRLFHIQPQLARSENAYFW